jgi:hypothetical protein
MVVVKVFYVSITLFADACSADASDAYEFNSAVVNILKTRT